MAIVMGSEASLVSAFAANFEKGKEGVTKRSRGRQRLSGRGITKSSKCFCVCMEAWLRSMGSQAIMELWEVNNREGGGARR